MNALPPGLHIVATPIGNLGDLSPRAAETLRHADRILVEDTPSHRQAPRAHRRQGADGPLRRSQQRRASATRSSRGSARRPSRWSAMPARRSISDPGYKLVRAARAAGHAVHTVPGPCAAIAALTLAGLPTDRFLFLGFLPAKAKARSDAIAEIADGPGDADALRKRAAARRHACARWPTQLGSRDAAVAREISKLHEECVTGTLARACRALCRRTLPRARS